MKKVSFLGRKHDGHDTGLHQLFLFISLPFSTVFRGTGIDMETMPFLPNLFV